ncbi:MAG: hypothetical protein OEU36_00300 [Gammaproteobacteria bacterium]|nr:hypothetical protein [Gammaproteobacteria bacterium]
MRNTRRVVLSLFIIAVLMSIAATPAITTVAATQESTAIMHRVFDAVAYLLPLSIDEDRFFDPSEQANIQNNINTLFESTKQLETHARGRDLEFALLSQSLSDTVGELKYYYEHDQPEYAQSYLFDLTQRCVACHSRLPSARDFPFAERLMDRVELDLLSLQGKAELQVATRQFSDALSTWEALFADLMADPIDIDIDGDLVDYLVVSIRVLHQLDRPKQTLEIFSRRPDLPFYIRRHLEVWLSGLEELSGELGAPPNLQRARTLFTQADDLSVFPAGRERVIQDLVVSSILYRYIDEQEGRQEGADIAEAYYMLGVIEARTVRPYWAVPQVEFLFEAAIRAAPDGPFAKEAYAVLEEYSLLGSSSPQVLERVEQLRQMVEPL